MSSKDWTKHEFKRGKAKMNHYANTRFNWGTEANVQSVHSYPAHLFGAFPLAQNLSYTFDFSRMTWVNKNCDHFCKNFPSLEHSGLRSKVSNISNGTLLIAKLAQDEEKIRRMNIFPVLRPHTHSQSQSTSPPLSSTPDYLLYEQLLKAYSL